MNVDTVTGDTAPSAAVLNARPLRNEESASWELEDGLAVITHAKEFSRLEGWVRDRIGGPGELRRPLDRFTTFLWLKCDGAHTVAGLVAALEAEFGEEAAPAAERVQKWLQRMLELGLLRLESGKRGCCAAPTAARPISTTRRGWSPAVNTAARNAVTWGRW